MKLNIACGANWRDYPEFKGVDIVDFGQQYMYDALSLYELFSEGGIEEIICNHFLEHLDQDDAVRFLNVCWFLLKDGGKLHITVPHKDQDGAYNLTHCTYYTEDSFYRLPESAQALGLFPFDIVSVIKNDRPDVHVDMIKKKRGSWEYLNTNKRIYALAGVIGKLPVNNRYVFDFMCGHGVLMESFIQDMFGYEGFDNDLRCVLDIRARGGRCDWITDMQKLKQTVIWPQGGVYLHLGICGGDTDTESLTEAYTSAAMIRHINPEYIVLEKANSVKDRKRAYIDAWITKMYQLEKEMTYHVSGHKNLLSRTVWIYGHK